MSTATSPDLPGWAADLGLQPHPEGGYFVETWRSEVSVPPGLLPAGYRGPRRLATAILYLLLPGQRSAWHRVLSDELWLHHRGGPLRIALGGSDPAAPSAPGGPGSRQRLLGPGVERGELPQVLVPGGTWQSAEPAGDEPVLVSCVVAPGFDARDFQLLAGDAGA